MKKLLLLALLLTSVGVNAQTLNWRYYDSVQVWPKFNIRNLPEGQSLDSLLSRNSRYNTQRIHPRQLPISTATQNALNLKYDASNPSGYISSYTETDPTVPTYSKSLTTFNVIKASTDPLYKAIGYTPSSAEITSSLGYTPYNGTTNPNGYISSAPVSSVFGRTGTISAQSGDYNTSQVTESGNLYYTTARFNTAFSGKTTTDLAEGTNQYFTSSRARSAFSAGSNITYDSGGGVISLTQPTLSTTARTLNSNFTISTTKFAQVAYSVSLSVTNPLLVGSSTASVFLEYSTNGGSSWNLVSQASNSSQVGITVTIAITNVQTSVISGIIPANALVRLRSTSSGTALATFVSSQEVVY